jgi:hypothetical protein
LTAGANFVATADALFHIQREAEWTLLKLTETAVPLNRLTLTCFIVQFRVLVAGFLAN